MRSAAARQHPEPGRPHSAASAHPPSGAVRASCPHRDPPSGSGCRPTSPAPAPFRAEFRDAPRGRGRGALRAATHLDLKVGQAERGAKERAEVRDGRDFPPGAELAQPGRAALLRAHLPAAAVAAAAPSSTRASRPHAARPPARRDSRRGAAPQLLGRGRRRLLLPLLPPLGVCMS